MSLFDFLFDHSTPTAPTSAPAGLLSMSRPPEGPPSDNVDTLQPTLSQATLQSGPQSETHEGLLSKLGSFVTSPNFLMALSTGIRAYGGDQNAFSDQARFQDQQLKMAEYKRQLALQQRGNQAFRAAYQNGKFDPKVYAQVMGDYLDPKAMAEIASVVRPKVSYQNDRILKEDQLTGDVTDAGQLPMGYAEQTAAANSAETGRHNLATEGHESAALQETGRHNRVEEGQGSARIGIEGANLGVAQGHLQLDKINAARAANPGAPVLASPQDYARFGGGTYIAPDGSVRVKPRAQ